MAKIDPDAVVTNKTLGEAVDSILEGVDRLIKEERSFNVNTFATKKELKEELRKVATAEDLKRETSWIRDDIKGLTADLSGTVSKTEFNKLKSKVDKYLAD